MEPEISTLSNIREKVGHRQERIVLKILLVKQKITFLFVTGKGKIQNKTKAIKGLLEPAHSYHALSLYWFLGLAEYRYSWIQFMWFFKTYRINFFYFGGSCVMRIGKKPLCGLEVGWVEVIRQSVSFLLVCVYVCGAGGGPVVIIRHQMLL